MKRFGAIGAALALGSTAWGTVQLDVQDFGVTPGAADSTPGMIQVLKKARESKEPVEIVFPEGIYHFHPDKAPTYKLYVSNHDQRVHHKVGIPIVRIGDCTINGNGSRFVFHGDMMPVLIMDSKGVTCRNFSISYATPFSAEGRIVETKPRSTTLEFAPAANPPWKVQDGKFILAGENGEHTPDCAIAFRPDGMIVPTGRNGDIVWRVGATRKSDTQVEFDEFNAAAHGYALGDTLVLRNATRPHPAMMLYHATGTLLEGVVFHDSQGMAMLAQRSTGIHVKGGGCLCAPGRVHSVSADACHFSNCRGEVIVEDATFEAMMDDAINVHATSLRIDAISKDRRRITLTYCHRQAFGFETFKKGERVRFIHAATLENVKKCGKVTRVVAPNPMQVQLTLESPVPKDICVGDAVENADWHPSVVFRNNTVRNNRARGALFTTPKRVLVEGNRFIHSSGSAILLAGDAAGWYESGACKDVTIRGNEFDHNLTCRYQFTHAIISICPEIAKPGEQKVRYHRNIRIAGNTFRTHRVPLLYAISAEDVTMQGNTVEYDDQYASMDDGTPYRTEHCGKMELQEP